MSKQEEIHKLSAQLRDMDANISEFLEKNEKKFGGIDDEDADYTTPVWQEYKRLINQRKEVSVKLKELTRRGFI